MEDKIMSDMHTQCANCLEDCTGSKIIKICGKYDRTDASVAHVLAFIFGFPLEHQLPEKVCVFWNQSECGLCANCARIVTQLFQAFQELQTLARETSIISRGLEQFHKCLEKHFSNEKNDEESVPKKSKDPNIPQEGTKRRKTGRRTKRATKARSKLKRNENSNDESRKITPVDSETKSTENIPAASLICGGDEDNDDSLNLAIVKVETLIPEQCTEQKNTSVLPVRKPTKAENNVPCNNSLIEELPISVIIGSTEIISDGKVIRTSTRVRKMKKPLDLEESSNNARKSTKSRGKGGGRLPSVASVSSSPDSDSELWSILYDEMYYNDGNLATLPDGMYICPDVNCTKAFKGLKTLNRHALVHDLDRPYRCTKCDQVFSNRGQIKAHQKQIHALSNIKTEKLTTPPKKFNFMGKKKASTAATSGQHLKIHKKFSKVNKKIAQTPPSEKPFKCEHCDKQFLLKRVYNKHLLSHDKPAAFCRCNVCNQTFPTALGLARHIADIHNDKTNETDDTKPVVLTDDFLKCEQCNKTFKKRYQLNMHVLFHNDVQPRFGCSMCPKLFFQPGPLRTHMLVHNQKNPLLCTQCDKIFERRDHFKRHMEMVHNKNGTKNKRKRKSVTDGKEENESESHSCPECKKTFTRKEYLRLHIRIHTGEKPHICPTCGKQFRDPRNLAQHLVTHTSDRPFCCSVCGLTFKRAHHLNDHESTHRENVARPFVCAVAHCGKAFKLRKHLVSHELVHSGKKDEVCHVCGRSFSRKDNLRQHINKIHGKKQAEELLAVVEQQRERYLTSKLEQQNSLSSSSASLAILEEDVDTNITQVEPITTVASIPTTETVTAVVPSITITPKTTKIVVAPAIPGGLISGTSGQISQVLQIIPGDVVTTLAVPLTSIVATFPAPTTLK